MECRAHTLVNEWISGWREVAEVREHNGGLPSVTCASIQYCRTSRNGTIGTEEKINKVPSFQTGL
jgi:hypothetical protein